jgi:hypothetical protein
MQPPRLVFTFTVLLVMAGCTSAETTLTTGSDLLYVWSADADEDAPDFLAVIDAAHGSPTYGTVLHTVPVEGRGQWSHHTEYELTPGRTLFASGWGTGGTFVFDMTDPLAPTVANVFTTRGGYGFPHSYARLPNGNVLATFQASGEGYGKPGGLVELTDAGEFVRGVSGGSPDVPENETWTYSLLVLPDLDRVVSTNTRMGLVSEWKSQMRAAHDTSHEHVSQDVTSTHVQVWRLSDLTLLHTLKLPPNAAGQNAWTAEARRLANGDVYVNTFSCGLYRLTGLDTDAPAAVPALFSPYEPGKYCAVPVTIGNYWIQPSATERAIVALDLSDPANPREASRLTLDSAFTGPHWIAADPAAPRIVVTSDEGAWVLIANFDPATGALSLDEGFRDSGAERPGLNFDRSAWPHGSGGRAMPHGALFGSR